MLPRSGHTNWPCFISMWDRTWPCKYTILPDEDSKGGKRDWVGAKTCSNRHPAGPGTQEYKSYINVPPLLNAHIDTDTTLYLSAFYTHRIYSNMVLPEYPAMLFVKTLSEMHSYFTCMHMPFFFFNRSEWTDKRVVDKATTGTI